MPPALGLPCALLAREGRATKQSSGGLRRENATARRPNGREVRPQVPQEEHLADDRRKARALGFEDAENRGIGRLGLLARIARRTGGLLAREEEFPGLGALHPTQNDRTAMHLYRFDRGMGMGRH